MHKKPISSARIFHSSSISEVRIRQTTELMTHWLFLKDSFLRLLLWVRSASLTYMYQCVTYMWLLQEENEPRVMHCLIFLQDVCIFCFVHETSWLSFLTNICMKSLFFLIGISLTQYSLLGSWLSNCTFTFPLMFLCFHLHFDHTNTNLNADINFNSDIMNIIKHIQYQK